MAARCRLGPYAAAGGGRCRAPSRASAGFTLIELMLVVLLVGVVLSLAIPHLAPMIAYGKLEGAARHLAAYGAASMAHAALAQERITLRVDLAAEPQEYWCVRLREDIDTGLGKGSGKNKTDGFGLSGTGEADTGMQGLAGTGASGQLAEATDDELAEMATQVQEQFDHYFEAAARAQAQNVKQKGFLADVGPKFKKFSLEDEEDQYEELTEDLLARTAVPQGVLIESVRVGGVEHASGLIEIEVSPLGLTGAVDFVLRSGDDDYYTVVWDPITGYAHVRSGREEVSDAASEASAM